MKSKILTLYLIFSFSSLFVFSQKKTITKKSDYKLLNKTLSIYFKNKSISDSLFYNSQLYKEHKKERTTQRAIKRRKKKDTLFLKAEIDNTIYRQFFNKPKKWSNKKFDNEDINIEVILTF